MCVCVYVCVGGNESDLACKLEWWYIRTWSMAQGMRHRMSLLSPKTCGKEVLNAGAACTAGNATLPTEGDRMTNTE